MKNGPDIAAVGALVGDPARANMLTSLMSGQALTATELAREAGIAAATASGHLAKLLEGGLLLVERQGRHRYYRIAGPDAATAIEALMGLVEHAGHRRVRAGPKDLEMREARVCYDHLAGARGVALFARMTSLNLVVLHDGSITMTQKGEQQFRRFGIDIVALKAAKRPVCRTCLDWGERRTHLAGSLGTMLLDRFFENTWMHRLEGSRVVKFTPSGEAAFATLFE